MKTIIRTLRSRVVSVTRPTGTRNAVETAIDLAKSDYGLTWDQQLAKHPRKVSQWENNKCNDLQVGR